MSIKGRIFSNIPSRLLLPLPRPVRERWLPLAVSNELRIREALRAGERVLFVSSYPRSGNTWLRKLMADLLLQRNGRETGTSLPLHQDELIPDREFNAIGSADLPEAMPGLPVKTHDAFSTVRRLYPAEHAAQVRHIYIYRQPADALVSYYHFHLRYEHLKEKIAGLDAGAFCLDRLESWKEHLRGYLRAEEEGARLFLLSYERLSDDPVPLLLSLFDWLDFPVEQQQAAAAVEHQQFRKLREKEAKDPMNEEEFFFRKGQVGGGREELGGGAVEVIEERSRELLDEAAARLDAQLRESADRHA